MQEQIVGREDYNAPRMPQNLGKQNLTAGQVMNGEQKIGENRMRSLSIRQLDHGYIVEVGCQTFAIESAANLIAKLSQYIANPSNTENKWREKELF